MTELSQELVGHMRRILGVPSPMNVWKKVLGTDKLSIFTYRELPFAKPGEVVTVRNTVYWLSDSGLVQFP